MLIYLQMIETEADKSKFVQVYQEYRDLMYHVALKLLKHPQDAEDAVGHAFEQVAKNIQKISAPVCPKTKGYVVTIVERKAIDMLRKRNRHPEVELDEETAGIAAEYEVEDHLAACILQLPARQREVILLKYRHGYSLREIAQILGITLTAANKLDQRAKQRLHELYYGKGADKT